MREHVLKSPPKALRPFVVRAHVPSNDVGSAPIHDPGASEVAVGLVCPCGSELFRVLGVPASMARGAGRGSYILRSLLRVVREVRVAAAEPGQGGGLLGAPIEMACVGCGTRLAFGLAAVPDPAQPEPALEAYRCRPCRRSTMRAFAVLRYKGLDLSEKPHPGDEERYDRWRLVLRCATCRSVADVANESLRSDRDLAIDRLYGRTGGRTEADIGHRMR